MFLPTKVFSTVHLSEFQIHFNLNGSSRCMNEPSSPPQKKKIITSTLNDPRYTFRSTQRESTTPRTGITETRAVGKQLGSDLASRKKSLAWSVLKNALWLGEVTPSFGTQKILGGDGSF